MMRRPDQPETASGDPDVFVYVTSTDLREPTGQASFDRSIIPALRRFALGRNVDFHAVAATRDDADLVTDAPADVSRVTYGRSSLAGYARFQWDLYRTTVALIGGRRRAVLLARYHPTMVGVLAASIRTRAHLVVRTGPPIAGLASNRSDVNANWYPLVRMIFSLVLRRARRVVVVTDEIAQRIAGTNPSAVPKIVVVPNGVDCERFRPVARDRSLWGLDPTARVVGFAGSLDANHDFATLFAAIARLHCGTTAPVLAIAGSGPAGSGLQALAETHGVADRVRLVGRVAAVDIPRFIAACDVMVQPLTRRDIAERGNSGMKLFEALACDRPVVASKSDDTRFLERLAIGAVAASEDPDAWAAAIRHVLVEGHDGMDGRARSHVVRMHGIDRVAQELWDACTS